MKSVIREIVSEIKKIQSTRKELREFAFVVGGVLAAIGALLLWKGRPAFTYFLIPGALLILFGFLNPFALKPLQKVWMALALVMGAFMSRLILGLLFFLGITPIHFIARLFGKRFLDLSFRQPVDSYWIHYPETKTEKGQYEKQF
jgi:hypothetical protein